MSNKNASQNSSLKDDELICPSCGSNICQIHNQNEHWLNVCFDFNEDNYRCLACNSIIKDSEIIDKLNLRLNPKSFWEKD